MIRAAALSVLLLLGTGAAAKDCFAPFAGAWQSEDGNIEVFGHGTLAYQKPDMAKPAPLHVVADGSDKEADDVSLKCGILDRTGVAQLLAKLRGDAAATTGPAYVGQVTGAASVEMLLQHPPYPMITARYYEGVSYYIRVGDGDLIAVEYEGPGMDVVSLKKKD